MQHLLGFNGKDIFNMDSTGGTLMTTSVGLSQLRPRPVPNGIGSPRPERPSLSLPSLLSNIFSGRSCESFEEGYSQLTHSGIQIRRTMKLTVYQKAVKVRPLFLTTSVLVEKLPVCISFFQITGIPI